MQQGSGFSDTAYDIAKLEVGYAHSAGQLFP